MKKILFLLLVVLVVAVILIACKDNREQEVIATLKRAEEVVLNWPVPPNDAKNMRISLGGERYLVLSDGDIVLAEGQIGIWKIDLEKQQITYGKLKKGFAWYKTETKPLSAEIKQQIKALQSL